ncbi:GroES-like protein [Pseudovirgaria hyperparasitica]|uniref:GroES-like protein n=1 Tax=Pseudovirgaria hyperparasitica TaxID=470096 RepID=A0A6A6W7B1_9PEZI|nr:GroES-like protein [Pseudovirgaria hyperparasitica]KAF2758742.1 GroES-like protein [Pseudovirgaria hyperparasitica]
MSDNRAAFRDAADRRFIIRDAEDQFAEDNEIVIRNAAISLNPVDKYTLYDRFPQIPGADVAGEVIEVGLDVTAFQEGDRVLGHALAIGTKENRHGAFQRYTAIPDNMAARIPRHISYQSAAALPLGVSTAAAALFQKDFLALSNPTVPPATLSEPRAVVIIGASGNVGSNAVQLAKAAGYTVIGTASTSSAKLVKDLGAQEVVDDRVNDKNVVVENVKKALNGMDICGVFDAAGMPGTHKLARDIVIAVSGRKIAVTTQSYEGEGLEFEGVTLMDVMAVAIQNNEVGKMVYGFLQKALQMKSYQVPDTVVVGKQLGDIYGNLDGRGKKIILME